MLVKGQCAFEGCSITDVYELLFEPFYLTGCDEHMVELDKRYITSKRRTSVDLHQKVDSWVGSDGKKHAISKGKQWEIENRVISRDDGKTMINRATGKPAQY